MTEHTRSRPFEIIVMWAGLIVTFLLGAGLWTVRSLLPILGLLAVGCLALCMICGVALVLEFTIRRVTRVEYQEIGQFGTVSRSLIGRSRNYAPLALAAPKVAGSTKVTEIQANIPRLGDLIAAGELVKEGEDGKLLMLQGFRLDESARYGEWPGVIGVSGMQNVGKSVTIEMLAIIALMSQAHVVVCDTHHMKARSLYKKLQCLEGLITFARTEKEVLREAQKFSSELARRKEGSEPAPYVFILDEAASVIRSDIGDEIVAITEEASQEGHGYNLHMVLAIHDFSKDGLGDARIRSFLNWIYCHRMEAGQSKFIQAFNSPKTKKAIAALPVGHTVARDEVNEIEYLIIPFGDSKDALVARKLLENAFPRFDTPARIPETASFMPETNGFNRAETERFTEPERILSVAPVSETEDFTTYQGRKTAVKNLRREGFRQTDIIHRVWGYRPGATEGYTNALAEYKHILQNIMEEVSI